MASSPPAIRSQWAGSSRVGSPAVTCRVVPSEPAPTAIARCTMTYRTTPPVASDESPPAGVVAQK